MSQASESLPELAPDEHCNARLTDASGEHVGYCDETAGKGTDHEGTGRCKLHGGSSTGPKTEASKLLAARVGGAGTATHGTTADPFKYHLAVDSKEETRFVLETAQAIENRIEENTGDIDFLDQILARNAAKMLHVAAKASEHFTEDELFERIRTDEGMIEVPNRMLDHIRQYNKDLVRILKDIGAAKDDGDDLSALAIWKDDLK